jgi:hypothetical protein
MRLNDNELPWFANTRRNFNASGCKCSYTCPSSIWKTKKTTRIIYLNLPLDVEISGINSLIIKSINCLSSKIY